MKIERERDKKGYLNVIIEAQEGDLHSHVIEKFIELFILEVIPLHHEITWNSINCLVDLDAGRYLIFPGRHEDYDRDEKGLCQLWSSEMESDYNNQCEIAGDSKLNEVYKKCMNKYVGYLCKSVRRLKFLLHEKAPQYKYVEVGYYYEEGESLLVTSLEKLPEEVDL